MAENSMVEHAKKLRKSVCDEDQAVLYLAMEAIGNLS